METFVDSSVEKFGTDECFIETGTVPACLHEDSLRNRFPDLAELGTNLLFRGKRVARRVPVIGSSELVS